MIQQIYFEKLLQNQLKKMQIFNGIEKKEKH